MHCPRSLRVRIILLTTALSLFGMLQLAAAQAASRAENSARADRVAGIVVSKSDGHPLARARVTLAEVKNRQKPQSVITADDGKFEFTRLPPAKYSLFGAKRGFINAGYDQHDAYSTAIVTGAGLDTEHLVLKLSPDAVITGQVLDEAEEPARHAQVILYRDNHQEGVNQIQEFRRAQTDDQGIYELASLIPGTYFVSADATPWYAVHPQSNPQPESAGNAAPASSVDRSLDVAYPVTYYADTTESESATPISIRGGERLQADIHLSPVPALHLIFHVTGDPQHGFVIPRLEQPAFDSSTFVQTDGGRMISPGEFEIAGIPAGRYDIRLQGPGAAAQMNGVVLEKDGEEIDTSTGESFSTVKVSVQIPGEKSLPPQLTIALRSGTRTLVRAERLDEKGEAEIQQIPAGRYEVLAFSTSKPFLVSRLSAEGAEVLGRDLIVKAGSSPSVSVTLTSGSAVLQGTAKRAGKGFAGAMVVLVPQDPETHHDLFRRDQSDLDGTFSLAGVLPGSYTVVAIDNGWDLDWSQPAVMAAYLKHGKKIEVGNQISKPLDLDSIEVQSK